MGYKLSENESNDDVHEPAHAHAGRRRGEDPDHRPNSSYHQYRQRQPRDFQSFETPISNLNNNHDQDKRPYRSKEDAKVVVHNMKQRGHDPNDTLVVYFNRKLGAWFVGN